MATRTRLQAARQALGWGQERVARMINERVSGRDLPVKSTSSLKSELSRWENGHVVPDPPMRAIFREIYGRTDTELGFPVEAGEGVPEQDALGEELRDRLVVATRVDDETISLFRHQVDHVRHADRRFGSFARLDQLNTEIGELEDLLSHSTLRRQRAPLAGVLTEASTLAGWDSLDSGALQQAWKHYERAKAAAAESGSLALLAHATAEQAFVLIEAGEQPMAVELLVEARELGSSAPRLLRAWLAAAEGEGLAAAGDRTAALRAFDEAEAVLPAETTHPELPFLFLGGPHLHRWRGNALVRLGDREAIERLEGLLDQMPTAFVRARAATLIDLALAHGAAGAHERAQRYAREARRMISQLGSARLRHRLERLVLPGISVSE